MLVPCAFVKNKKLSLRHPPYSYVLNNPVNATDPGGLWCVWEDGTHDDDMRNGGASEGNCADQGGHWDRYDTITGIYQQDGIVTQINTIYGPLAKALTVAPA